MAVTAPSRNLVNRRRVAAGERARERGDAPKHYAEGENRDSLGPVDKQPDGQHEHGARQERNRAQEPDLGVADVQRVLELGGDRTDRRRIGARERQHGAEQRDHSRSRRPADPGHIPATEHPTGRVQPTADRAKHALHHGLRLVAGHAGTGGH